MNIGTQSSQAIVPTVHATLEEVYTREGAWGQLFGLVFQALWDGCATMEEERSDFC